MKKLMMLVLAFCLMLGGCGTESGEKMEQEFSDENRDLGETEEPRGFHLDESELENGGYEKISAIAFVKIEDGKEEPKVYIKYLYEEPEISFYFVSAVMREFNSKCDIVITWDGKDYPLDEEATSGLTEETLYKAFPEDWKELIKEIQSGNGIDNLITKGNADIIDKAVEEFVSEYKKKQEDRKEKEETENASEEKEANIIDSKKYEVDGEDVGISLSETDGIFDISIIGNAKDEQKASIMFVCYKMLLDEIDGLKKYDIAVMAGEKSIMCFKDGEETTITGTNKDGSLTFSTPDWIVTDLSMPEEDVNSFSEEIANTIKDFVESAEMNN